MTTPPKTPPKTPQDQNEERILCVILILLIAAFAVTILKIWGAS